jgi:excisionase family DNA binding protein
MQPQIIELITQPERPTAIPITKVLLTVKEAAEICSLSVSSINRLIERGKLPVKYIGTSKRIAYEAIRKWANEEA